MTSLITSVCAFSLGFYYFFLHFLHWLRMKRCHTQTTVLFFTCVMQLARFACFRVALLTEMLSWHCRWVLMSPKPCHHISRSELTYRFRLYCDRQNHWVLVQVCQCGQCEIDLCYLIMFCRFYHWAWRKKNGKYDAVSLRLVLALLVTRCLHTIHQKYCDLVVAFLVVIMD